MNTGPILYIGGDEDDKYLVANALVDIGCSSEVINFRNGLELIAYLRETAEKPFLILCDLHIPMLNGLELKERINADIDLKKRSIPFIFLSESVVPEEVDSAYLSLVQGFYVKPPSYEQLKVMLSAICTYWELAVMPGRYSEN